MMTASKMIKEMNAQYSVEPAFNKLHTIHNEFMKEFGHLNQNDYKYLSVWAMNQLRDAWEDSNEFQDLASFRKFYVNYQWS